jgi:hypothetical protein
MTFIHPKCAKCMAERDVFENMDCDGRCRQVEERTLVDMDKGTHYDTTQEVGEMERDRFDYMTGQKGTWKTLF